MIGIIVFGLRTIDGGALFNLDTKSTQLLGVTKYQQTFDYSFIYNHSNLVNLQCCIWTPWSSFKVRSGLPYLVFKYFRNSHRNINQNILISCFVILYFYFQYQLFVTYYFSAYITILVSSHPHMQTTQTMKQNITSHFIQPTTKNCWIFSTSTLYQNYGSPTDRLRSSWAWSLGSW